MSIWKKCTVQIMQSVNDVIKQMVNTINSNDDLLRSNFGSFVGCLRVGIITQILTTNKQKNKCLLLVVCYSVSSNLIRFKNRSCTWVLYVSYFKCTQM